MKYFFLSIVCMMMVSLGNAQFRKIPEEVLDSCHKRYPEVEDISWTNKGKTFKASFLMMDVKFEVFFTEEGRWLQCAQEIKTENIPDDVKYYLKKTPYKEWPLKDVYFVVGPDDRVEYRLLMFKNAVQQKYLFFDKEGHLHDIKDGREMML